MSNKAPTDALRLDKLEAPSEDQIKHAVRRAESRFFGTRHLSEQEHLAVDTLVRAASALSAARASARRDADGKGEG